MKLKAKDYLSRPVRLPHWLRLLLMMGLVCLAGSAFMALKDLDRERMNLEQLYIQKGESLIRSLGVGLRRDWIIEKSQQDMATFIAIDQSSDVMFLATSDYQGRLRGASMTDEALGEGTLGVPDPPEAFHPQWTPHFKTVTLPDGQRAFVVYRPLLYSLESAPKTPTHHVKEPKAPPVWPPEDLDFAHPQRALYCWVGFEMGPFEKAVAAGHRNAMIFSLLIGLVLSSVLLAVSWSLKFMRNYAVTNEIITRLPIGLILNNPQGQVILANQAAQRLAEIPESGFLGRTLGELTHGVFPDDKELTAHEMDISFREGRSLRLSVTCGTITGPGGVGLGRIVLMADLGELNRLKEALSKQEHL
ncbi:MAG: hypothetical protein LBL95_04135, partial [Deltaproteobacteria bacterium]|nr:hypothetical protein [Deltaproteobacteria bacterium]